MKLNRTKGIALAIGVVLLAVLAFSQTVKRVHLRHGDMFSEHMLQRMTEYLNLTDAQQAQMKEILAKEKPAMKTSEQQIAQGHQQMLQLVTSGNFDETKAREIASQQAGTMTEMEVQKARVASEMFQVLTPDQKTKAIQFLNDMQKRRTQHQQGQPGSSQNQDQ
jgi:protein CpxP